MDNEQTEQIAMYHNLGGIKNKARENSRCLGGFSIHMNIGGISRAMDKGKVRIKSSILKWSLLIV